MKTLFNILRNIFAILGVLFVALVVYAVADDLEINIDRSYQSSLDRFLHSLKKSRPYVQDTLTFHIQSVPDSAKAAERTPSTCGSSPGRSNRASTAACTAS